MSPGGRQLLAVAVFMGSAMLAAGLARIQLSSDEGYEEVRIGPETVGPALRSIRVELGSAEPASGVVADGLEVADADPRGAGEVVTRAARFRRLGEPERAIALLEEQVGQVGRNDGPLLAELGAALIAAERLDDAEERLVAALKRDPQDVRSHYNLGVARSQRGALEAARDAYLRVLELSPNHTRALFNLGTAELRSGRYEAAERLFLRLLEVDRTVRAARACFQLGVICARTDRPEEAIEWYRRAVRRKPDYAEARNNLALVLEDAGRVSAAIDVLRKAAALEPVNAAAHYNLGRLLADRGRTREAISALETASSAEKELIKAHLLLADLLIEDGRARRAVEPLRRAFEARGGDAQLAERIARLHRDGDRYAEAAAWLERAVELRPTLGRLWNALGIVQGRLERMDAASRSYRRSIELEPQQTAARFNLGLLLERRGDPEAAARRFREVLSRDPRHVGARRHLVKILVELEHPDREEEARKLARVSQDTPEGLATAGYAFLKLGRPDLAEPALRRAVELDPASQAPRFNLGLAQLRLDQPAEAVRTFSAVAERWPGDPKTQRFLARARERAEATTTR